MTEQSHALAEIKAAHPGQLMITTAQAAVFIGKSPLAAAKLAQRGSFPVPIKKVGARWMVNAKALADFIDGAALPEPPAAASSAAKAPKASTKPKGRTSRDETSKTVRPPPMSKVLMALRGRIEQARAELDLQLAVFAEVESQALAFDVPKAEPRKRRKPL